MSLERILGGITFRSAHEKVQQILKGSVDTALWQALRIVQGSNLEMPALNNQPALARAFDRTAGQAKAAEARKVLKEAEAVLAQVQEHHAGYRAHHAASAALLEQARKDHLLALERLETERTRRSDDGLNSALVVAEALTKSAHASLDATQVGYGNTDPASAKAILDTSESALKSARDQCDAQDRDLIVLRTRLDLIGDKGLAEALAGAQRVTFEASDSLDRLLRRATAAKLLYDTLRAEREAMRSAYVAPLREGIERFGRHVFGPTLRVEVDESLRVVSRTVGGVTVSLAQLSTGAREQMGLLVRLAAASMVSKDGGVPLVLDDALGSTDEGRLESMGAVLRIASRDMQTIILTCAPERYVHVGAQVSAAM